MGYSDDFYTIKYSEMSKKELENLLVGACENLSEDRMRNIRSSGPNMLGSVPINLWMWYLDRRKK